MADTRRIAIVPLGWSLGLFFAITFVLCVLFGLFVSARGMHELLPMLLPGFTWITWTSFFIGLAWAFGYGWYVALIFAPLHNLFFGPRQKNAR
jgi:hypothetical protein